MRMRVLNRGIRLNITGANMSTTTKPRGYVLYEVIAGSGTQAADRAKYLRKYVGLKARVVKRATGIRGYSNYQIYTKPSSI